MLCYVMLCYVMLCYVMLLSFGVEFHRVWIWLKSAHDEMWLRTSELSFKRRSVFPSNVFCIAAWTSKLVNNRTSVFCCYGFPVNNEFTLRC